MFQTALRELYAGFSTFCNKIQATQFGLFRAEVRLTNIVLARQVKSGNPQLNLMWGLSVERVVEAVRKLLK